MLCCFFVTAIYLKDVNFVKQLLSLGAQKTVSSALTLAINLADRFGKSNALSEGTNGDDDDDDYDAMDISVDDEAGPSVLQNEFDRIVDLLREYRSSVFNTAGSEHEQASSGGENHHSSQVVVSTAPQGEQFSMTNSEVAEGALLVSSSQAMGQSGSLAEPPSVRQAELHHTASVALRQTPKLPSNWLTQGIHSKLCRYWNKEHFCRYGVRAPCHFLHKHGPWREHLEQLWKEMNDHSLPFDRTAFREYVRCREQFVGEITWYTAGFANVTMKEPLPKTIIYAEGGNEHVSSQGVSWYLTREEAYAALERAVIVSVWAAARRRKPLAFESGVSFSQDDSRKRHSSFASQVKIESSSQGGAQRRNSYAGPSDRDRNFTSHNYSHAPHHQTSSGNGQESFGQWPQNSHHDSRYGSYYPNSHNSVQDGSFQWRSAGSESQYHHDNRPSPVPEHQNHWRSTGSGSRHPPSDCGGGGSVHDSHYYHRSASFESGRERDYREGSQDRWRSTGSSGSHHPPSDSRGGGSDRDLQYTRSGSFESGGRDRDHRGGSRHSRRFSG